LHLLHLAGAENEYLCSFHGEAPQHHGKASQKKISCEIFSKLASVFIGDAPSRKNEYLFISCCINIHFQGMGQVQQVQQVQVVQVR